MAGVLQAINRKSHRFFFSLGLDLPSALRVFLFVAHVSKNSIKQVKYRQIIRTFVNPPDLKRTNFSTGEALFLLCLSTELLITVTLSKPSQNKMLS